MSAYKLIKTRETTHPHISTWKPEQASVNKRRNRKTEKRKQLLV
jgi:hypothetical protein